MSKIIPFKDMRVEKPDTYKITRSDGIEEIVKIEFAPGMIYEQGTKDNAENFNSIQNNCVYRVDGVRKIEGNEEIYDIVITDYSNYTPSDLTILINIDSSNTTEAPKIRLNKEKYSIINEFGNVPIDFLTSKNTFTIILDYIKKTAKITSGDYKLKPATSTVLGGVKVGGSLIILNDVLYVNAKTEQLTNTDADVLSSSASRALFENGVGADVKGYIEDGTQHNVGEVWLSRNNKGEFKCLSANSDNYIDANKWLRIDDNENASKLETIESLSLLSGKIILYKQNKTVWIGIKDIATNYTIGQTIATITDSNFFPKYSVELLFISPTSTTSDKGRIGISDDGVIFARDSFTSGNGKSSNGVYFTK